MSTFDRGDTIAWLRSLPENEFVHLLAEACRGRAVHQHQTDVRYVVAQVWRGDGDDAWTVELIAPEDRARYAGTRFAEGFPAADYPIVRSAECRGCGLRVCSWARWVRCPVCDSELSCS